MADRRVIVGGAFFVLLLVALWLFPLVVFPHPGANDAIWLANLWLALLLLGGVGLVVAVVRAGPRRAAVCIELGVFAAGVAAAMLLGFVAFGNSSDDRFLPLLFLPPFIASPGLLLVVIGLVLRGDRNEMLRAAAYGFAAAVGVAVWILARGSRDWLLAPYGVDVIVLALDVGMAVARFRAPVNG